MKEMLGAVGSTLSRSPRQKVTDRFAGTIEMPEFDHHQQDQ